MSQYILVHRKVLLAHHELQVVDDHMVDVVHVDGVLHGVQHCSVGGVEKKGHSQQCPILASFFNRYQGQIPILPLTFILKPHLKTTCFCQEQVPKFENEDLGKN